MGYKKLFPICFKMVCFIVSILGFKQNCGAILSRSQVIFFDTDSQGEMGSRVFLLAAIRILAKLGILTI